MPYITEIFKELKKINIFYAEKSLENFLNLEEKDQTIVVNKVKALAALILITEQDCDAKRDAYSILTKLNEIPTLNCIVNKAAYFNEIKNQLNFYERISFCLDAALVGSTEVAETLFDQNDCNPQNNTYFLSYAICSGNNEWIKALVEKWNVDICKADYCFLSYASLLKNETLKSYYEAKKDKENVTGTINSVKNAFSQSQFFSPKKNQNENYADSKIHVELLESFDELLLGELEMLADIKEIEVKKLLIDVLFNPTLSTSDMAKYASVLDPVIGKRFAILYCCMYPKKWEEVFIKDFKNAVINSYVERSLNKENANNSFIYENKVNWLKVYANRFVCKFFEEREIFLVKLTPQELVKKENMLKNIQNIAIDLTLETESIEDEKKLIEQLIANEKSTSIHNSIVTRSSSLFKACEKIVLEPEAWKKLSFSDPRWKKIYPLIKQNSKEGFEQSEEKMLRVLSAILYKEEKGCRWRELPQNFLPQSIVRHYYYEWKTQDALKIIETMFASTSNVEKIF